MENKINTELLFLNLGLYEPVPFDEKNAIEIESLLINNSKDILFDCFCIECKKDSTFKYSFSEGKKNYNINNYENDIMVRMNAYSTPLVLVFKCQRDFKHAYSFMFRITNNKITKTGQFPSIASLESHSIDKYRKILKDDHREFTKALGLYSHGIGAGSFVYLRRIFENLIEDARQTALKETRIDDTIFQQSKMDEKIKLLEDYLPIFLVENRKLYSILSKGIHELNEKDCLELFPNVKLAIELILDEKIHKLERENKIQSVKKFIASTVDKHKN